MSTRVPAGLISYGAFTFVVGRSKVLPGFTLAMPTTHSAVAGAQFKVDRAARGQVALDYSVAFEYMLRPVGTLHNVQTQYDALVTAVLSAPVQLLTCFAVGDSTDHISGYARLESLTEVDGFPNHKRLHLSFFVETGLS